MKYFLVFLILSGSCMAGVTVSRNDVSGFLKHPKGSELTKNFELGETGDAIRLGKQYGSLSGTAVAPYRFPAKPKGGQGWPFQVELETTLLFVGPDGKPLSNEGMDAPEGSRVIETLSSWSLMPAVDNGDGKEAGLADSDPLQEVRDLQERLDEMMLTEKIRSLEPYKDIISADYHQWMDPGNNVRRAALRFGGDTSDQSVDAVYDEEGRPRYLHLKTVVLFEPPEGKPLGRVRQYRFYFSPDRQTLRVTGEFHDERSGKILESGADEEESGVPELPDFHGRNLNLLAAELRTADPQKAIVLADEFDRAMLRLGESPPSLDPGDWISADVPGRQV